MKILGNNYPTIVFARGIEIVSRFAFLLGLVRILGVTVYGQLSYEIALLQGAAAFLYTAFIQILAFEDDNSKQGVFKLAYLIHIGLFAILALLIGKVALIFFFYGFIYLLTAWYTSEKNQALFSFVRAASFLLLSLVAIFHGDVYLAFGLGLIPLVGATPFRAVVAKSVMPSIRNFTTMQVHNAVFQGTKILERVIAEIVLAGSTFGIYSILRDLAGGVNLALFSSYYQMHFKKYVEESRQVLAAKLKKVLLLLTVATVLAFVLGPFIDKLSIAVFSQDLPQFFLSVAVLLTSLDLLKALTLMILESRNQRRPLLTADLADLVGVLCLFTWAAVGDQGWPIFAVIFCLRFAIPIAANYRSLRRL